MNYHWIIAFLSGLLVNILAVLGFYFTQNSQALKAATINVMASTCVLFIIVGVIGNKALAIPYLTGLWFGTLIGIKIKAQLEKR